MRGGFTKLYHLLSVAGSSRPFAKAVLTSLRLLEAFIREMPGSEPDPVGGYLMLPWSRRVTEFPLLRVSTVTGGSKGHGRLLTFSTRQAGDQGLLQYVSLPTE